MTVSPSTFYNFAMIGRNMPKTIIRYCILIYKRTKFQKNAWISSFTDFKCIITFSHCSLLRANVKKSTSMNLSILKTKKNCYLDRRFTCCRSDISVIRFINSQNLNIQCLMNFVHFSIRTLLFKKSQLQLNFVFDWPLSAVSCTEEMIWFHFRLLKA